MKKIRGLSLFVVLLVIIAQVACGTTHFEKTYENDLFGFEYPPLFEVNEQDGTDVLVSEIGNPNPMMVFQMLEYKRLKKGDVSAVKERYLKVPKGIPEPDIEVKKIGGVKSLYYEGCTFGGATSSNIIEIFGYYIPLDDMVLYVQINPQVQDDLALGHRIIKTVTIK